MSLLNLERKCRFSNWKKQRLTFEFDWTKERESTNGQQ